MARVYVSSTYNDLQECRERVRLVLRRMGHEDIAMEYYVSEDKRALDKCLSDIKSCDLYIGIFAWRYGWIPPVDNPEQRSITELEYRKAQSSGKTCLVFFLSEEALWPPKFIDKDRTNIERFRSELCNRYSSGPHFKSADDLGRYVAEAVHEWEKQHRDGDNKSKKTQINFEAYRRAIIKRYHRLDLDALTPPQKEEYLQLQLSSIFVEQSVRENQPPNELTKDLCERIEQERTLQVNDLPTGMTLDDVLRARQSYYDNPSKPVLSVIADSRYQHLVILGDPGSGKSSLARYILLSLLDEVGEEGLRETFNGHVPLLIELRNYFGLCIANKCDTFLDYIEYLGKTEGWHLERNSLDAFLTNDGRAVVVFDGLDEIFNSADREQITRRIVGFAVDYPSVRVIVTSRIIGYKHSILRDAGFTHFTLQDLNEAQVRNFVDRWYALALNERPDEARERRQRILQSFMESASIRQLAGNPMLLTVMAIIGKHQELPRERWKLYEHAGGVLIQHWDINKHLKSQHVHADFIGEEDKKELLRRLAFKMQSGEGGLSGNYIHHESLQLEFESYLKQRYQQASDRAAIIAREMIGQFRERNFILSLYGASLYGFVHRAFLEYFCASAFVYKFEKTKDITLEQLVEDVYGSHWENRSWHEVLRLICGMVDEKFSGKIIDYLLELGSDSRPEAYHRRLPWNLALAIQCLSEVRNIGSITDTADRLLSTICSLIDADANDNENVSAFVIEQVIQYAKNIGPHWPNKGHLLTWLEGRDLNLVSRHNEDVIGEFIGAIGGGSQEIHDVILKYLHHGDTKQRVLAIFALATGWHECPRTLALVRERATGDVSEDVRNAAMAALVEYFRDHPDTLPLLYSLAQTDADEAVRGACLAAVGKYYRGDPRTLVLVRERASIDVSPLPDAANNKYYVREVAFDLLVKYWGNDPGTWVLIKERSEDDPTMWLRKKASLLLKGKPR